MSTPENPAVRKGWLTLQLSRTYIKQKFPHFMPITLGLIPMHVPKIGTMFVTKGMVLGIDMEWFGTEETEVGAGCIIHEDMHVLRDLTRIEAMEDKDVAGYAFDIPINDDLKAAKIQLPPWVVYSDTFGFPKGLAGEKYYELLMEKKRKNQLNLPGLLRIGAGRCGSCDGITLDLPNLNNPGRTAGDVRYFRSTGIQAIREHYKANPGNIPGSLRELIEMDGTEEVVIPWQQVTKTNVGKAVGRIKYGHADYSLKRPAKRSYAVGYPRPGLVATEPCVVFIEDTSGSMNHAMLKFNRVQLGAMLQQLGFTEVWFFCADVSVQTKPKRMSITELMNAPVVGRGGTDFRPAIAEAMRIRPMPNLIVYSTDGCGAAPSRKPPGVEFIWLLAPGAWTQSPCNWGTQILTTDDEDVKKKYTILN